MKRVASEKKQKATPPNSKTRRAPPHTPLSRFPARYTRTPPHQPRVPLPPLPCTWCVARVPALGSKWGSCLFFSFSRRFQNSARLLSPPRPRSSPPLSPPLNPPCHPGRPLPRPHWRRCQRVRPRHGQRRRRRRLRAPPLPVGGGGQPARRLFSFALRWRRPWRQRCQRRCPGGHGTRHGDVRALLPGENCGARREKKKTLDPRPRGSHSPPAAPAPDPSLLLVPFLPPPTRPTRPESYAQPTGPGWWDRQEVGGMGRDGRL